MRHVKTLLSDYADRALPEAQRRRVEEHLDSCGDCRSEYEALRQVSGLLSSLPRSPLPPGFMSRLEARRRREPSAPWRLPLGIPLRPAAMALASALVVFAVYDRLGDSWRGGDWPAPQDFAAAPSPEERPGLVPGAAEPSSRAADAEGGPGLGIKLAKADGRPLAEGASAAAASAPDRLSRAKAAPRWTNESLHALQEAEKRRMGIRRVIALDERPAWAREAERVKRELAAGGVLKLAESPAPAPITGATPALLAGDSLDRDAGRPAGGAGAGAPRALEPRSRVLTSAEELSAAWRAEGLPGRPPEADLSAGRLLLLLPPSPGVSVEVAAVRERAHLLIVQWRLRASSPGAPGHALERLPPGDKPVVLEPAP